jgi:hypothetical protein
MSETPRNWKRFFITYFVLIPIVGFALYTLFTLNFVYSHGERAGYIQKFSDRGWLVKTWEGEIAMANLPGTWPEVFAFTVRNDDVAKEIQQLMGQRVSISYDQHRGIPTRLFGETQYFVTSARRVPDAVSVQTVPATK